MRETRNMVHHPFTDMEYANRKRTTRREAFLDATESRNSLERMNKPYCTVLRPKRARQETDPSGNHATYVPHAELVRSIRREHRA